MAYNDYFVIVYKILAYLYKCLKSGEAVDIYNVLNAETYGIPESYFNYIIAELLNDRYISGVSILNIMGKGYSQVKITKQIKIKLKGIMYLQENSVFEKVKNFLKEAKEMIPGF